MTNMTELTRDGMTEKYAKLYLEALKADIDSGAFDPQYIEWAHSRGFSCHSASTFKVTEETYRQYISDYDWHKLWPMNDLERIWVNDKMTLRYMLCDPKYASILPKYYYYTDRAKGLIRLIDHPSFSSERDVDYDELLDLLSVVGALACKPNNGTRSEGFFKLACHENRNYIINNKQATKEDIIKFVNTHPNYIFTEYLEPAELFAKYDRRIPTIRLVTINNGKEKANLVGGFIRHPTLAKGEANLIKKLGKEDYNLLTDVNFNNGWFGNAKMVYFTHVIDIERHPITDDVMEGYLPDVQTLTDLTVDIANRFNLLDCLGFDFGLTRDGYKLMEINTHPGFSRMQLYRPLPSNPIIKDFIQQKLDSINALTEEQKLIRSRLR